MAKLYEVKITEVRFKTINILADSEVNAMDDVASAYTNDGINMNDADIDDYKIELS